MVASQVVVYRAHSVITMNDDAPRATAIAVKGARIVAVGDFDSVVALLTEPYDVNDEFAGTVIIPGLIDQHLHPMLGATTLTTEIIAPEDWSMPRNVHRAAHNADEYDQRVLGADARLAEGEGLYSWG